MDGFKAYLKSKTLWAILLAIGVLLGFRVADRFGVNTDDLKPWKEAALYVLLSAAALFRATATKQLGGPPSEPPGGGQNSPWLNYAVLLLILPAIFCAGCGARADVIAARETLYLGTSAMRAEHLRWTHALGPGGDGVSRLTASDVALREQWHKEIADYVAESRARDGGPTTKPAQ